MAAGPAWRANERSGAPTPDAAYGHRALLSQPLCSSCPSWTSGKEPQPMRAVDLIVAKRNGEAHTRDELAWLIGGLLDGTVPDYQMAAWLMAVCWRGMTDRETADLTAVMVDSGRRLDLHGAAPFVADKHSTGGVGDK